MPARRLRRGFLFLVLLATPVVVALRWPRERLLLDHASYIAATASWDEYRDHKRAAFGHNWLSDQEILFAAEGERHGMSSGPYYIYNTHNKTAMPATRYGKALQMADTSFGVRFSPDLQWFYSEHRNGDGLEVVKCDGTRSYTFQEKGYPLLWLSPDLYINAVIANDYKDDLRTGKDCLRLRSVTGSRILQDIPRRGFEISDARRCLYLGDHFVFGESTLDESTHQVAMQITATGLGLTTFPIRRQNFTVPIPEPQNLYDVEATLSPNGRRIAYRCVVKSISPLFNWLHRLLPRFDRPPQYEVALWVSDINGKHLHELGYIDRGTWPRDEDYSDTFLDIEWLPSGSKLAFRYQEKLYTVPIEVGAPSSH